MTNVNTTGVLGRRKVAMRKGRKPGAWATTLFLVWLALVAVPMLGLYNLDAFAPVAPDGELKPWMPVYQPII